MLTAAEKLQKIQELRDPNLKTNRILSEKAQYIKSELLQGEPGKDGYTPVKGKDYFDGNDGENGSDGYTPVKGVDYFDGKDGKNGETPLRGVDYWTPKDKEFIVTSAIAAIPKAKDGISVDKNEIITSVTAELRKTPVDFKDIKGTEELVRFLKSGGFRGGGGSGSAFTGVITDATLTGNGTAGSPLHVVSSATTEITGLIQPGTNITFTGTGTTLDPYIVNGTAGGVTSFNTRTGAVTLTSGDVTTALGFTPGQGTVTSVTGTTNRITSTGGSTPAIDISATFEALLGKVASPLSQFASTTSAQLAGVISDETGSGALVFGTSPTISGATLTTTSVNGVTLVNAGTSTLYLSQDGTYTTPSGTYVLPTASTSVLGGVKVDGTSITISGGVISATSSGGGTVTTVSVVTANGVSGSVANATTTPAITLTLGAITPTSVNSVVLSGSSTPTLAVTGTTTVSGANTGDQTITLTGAVTGSGTGSFATTIQSSIALPGNPTTTTQAPGDNSTKLATTAYADNAAQSVGGKEACQVATTANLVGVYLNGASGVGATFTYTATGVDTIDGVTLTLGMRVLLKNQTTTFQNGIYTVTTAGALGVAGILTRAVDFDQSSDIKTGQSVFIVQGTTLASTTWDVNSADAPVMGTDPITFVQSAGPGSFVAGNGITITGNSIAINTTITVDKTTAQVLTNKDLTSGTNTFPTFNQNTTGSAAKWTTARNLAGNSVDGSANVAFANKFIVQGTTDAGLTGAQFLGALGTGIVKNTTTTGVLSIAVAADFPTLNQNTTGSAATLTTPRAINGVNFDGSAPITVTAAAGTLTGTTLNSTVVTSSLTSVGTLGALTVTGNILNSALTASKVVFTDASKNLTSTGIGTSAQFIKGDGSLDSTTYLTSAGAVTSITGTTSQVIASASTGAVTLSLPQSIATSSTPQFAKIGLGAAADANRLLYVTGDVSGGVATIERTNATTSAVVGTSIIKGRSNGVAAVGFGTAFQFALGDSGTAEVLTGSIRSLLSGGTLASSPTVDMDFNTLLQGTITNNMTIKGDGRINFTQPAYTTGSDSAFVVTPGAHTNQTLSTEETDINFNLARTVQFATGALTTQRAFLVQAPTYGFVGSSTITTAATMAITGAPVVGTNAAITNRLALWIQNADALQLGTAGSSTGTMNFAGATSGVTILTGNATGTGTLTLPAATDTLVGRATTDTLTNKTLTSPVLVTPALGTPASGVMTNVTGTATGLTSGITQALASATTTVNVSSATAPTSGQVLTATSGTAATWQSPSGGTPVMIAADDFSSAARQQQVITGTGTTNFSNDGLAVTTGGTGSALTRWGPSGVLGTTNLEAGSPTFTATGYLNTLGTDEDMYIGMGQPTVASTAITFTVKHIGFKVVRSASGSNNLFATQADGTTENASSALTTIAVNDVIDLIVKVNGTTNASYYWRKNGGALSSATTLSANLPTGLTQCTAAVSSHNVSTSTEWNWGAWSYSR